MSRIRISIIAAIAAAAIHAASTGEAYTQTKPDLVVLIAVDQFSAGLFDQWRGRFKSGLKRLMDEGIVHSSAYQSHGLTETCAGHSTMLTGKHPGRTGIVSNEWFDTKVGDQVYCARPGAGRPAAD
jgi:predicted AlkP superfamily pyrophosphatase or phosphodiesterase